MSAPIKVNRNPNAGSGAQGANSIQLSITDLTIPTDKISDDFVCEVKVKNNANVSGHGTVMVKKDAQEGGTLIERRESSWGQSGGTNAEVTMKFTIPISLYKIDRKWLGKKLDEGKHQIYVEVGSGSETDGDYAKQDARTSPGFLTKKSNRAKNLNMVTGISLGLLVAMTLFTLIIEYAPLNTTTSITSSTISNGSLVVIEHPNIVVPIRNAVFPANTSLAITIYTNKSSDLDERISNVALSINPDSLLDLRSPGSPIIKTVGKTEIARYVVNGSIQHIGNVGNATTQSSVNVAIINPDTGATRYVNVPFKWNIKLLDFNQPMYFWLVLIGVMVSRYVSFGSSTTTTTNNSTNVSGQIQKATTVGQGDPLIWIIFSGVLALLIFAGFQDQVKLTNNVLFNLAAAFTFGFGFDKVLEKLKDVSTKTS